MPLCGSRNCGCAVQAGNGINLTGAGTAGSPWVIEAEDPALAGKVVYSYASFAALLADFPSPATNMVAFIYGSGENRLVRWTGSLWTPHMGGMAICERSSAQTITTSTWTLLQLNSDVFDPLGWHDPVTNNDRITPGKAGYYRVTFMSDWAVAAAAHRHGVGVTVNGSSPPTSRQADETIGLSSSSDVRHGRSEIVQLSADSDYIGVMVWQNSGGDKTVAGRVSVEFLSPL